MGKPGRKKGTVDLRQILTTAKRLESEITKLAVQLQKFIDQQQKKD